MDCLGTVLLGPHSVDIRDLTHVRRRQQGRRLLKLKCVCILLLNFAFTKIYSVCLSVLRLDPVEYATNALSSK